MNDKTIIKPRPGGRSPNPAAKQPKAPHPTASSTPTGAVSPVDDHTLIAFEQRNALHDLPSLSDTGNPLVDEAGLLLFINNSLGQEAPSQSVDNLRARCVDLIKTYEQQLRIRNVSEQEIEDARFCLCSLIDETVLNTPWGAKSDWSQESLLSAFHKETRGGTFFFEKVEEALALPSKHIRLIELQFLCLSLGFSGKMKLEKHGREKLETYRDQLFKAIRAQGREPQSALSPHWKSDVEITNTEKTPTPLWIYLSFIAAVLLLAYLFVNYKINSYSDVVYQQLAELSPALTEAQQFSETQSRAQSLALRQLMQTEIDHKLVSIQDLADRVRIRFPANALFDENQAQLNTTNLPVLSKLARALEGTEGKIKVTSSSRLNSRFGTKFPSNWHFSLARANAVADELADRANLKGRLWPEGKTDAGTASASEQFIDIDLLQRRL